MKLSKFSSLEELREELEAMTGRPAPKNAEEKFKKYGVRKRKIQYKGSCVKHSILNSHCASLGIQRTKLKRLQREATLSSMGERRMSELERKYTQAKESFHKEPCTCPIDDSES